MSEDLTTGIVRILTADDATAGTGFLVTDDGLIATCSHVVGSAGAGPGDTVRVAFHATGEEREAQVEPAWWRGPDAEDVAILRMDGPVPEGVTPLPLGFSAGVEGHTLSTFGFPDPKPVEGMAGKCEVVGRTTERGFPVLQLRSSEVTPGFSGAPVLDIVTRRVVGMATAITVPDQYRRLPETAFITPTETLRAICPELQLSDLCPYRGLAAFTEADAEFFFGREKLVADLVAHLRGNPRFLAVVGPSGSGKSSVVQAGLFPALCQGEVPGSEDWHLLPFRPGADPFAALITAGLDVPQNGNLLAAIRAFLETHPQVKRLVLFADQFEELFTLCPQSIQEQFLRQLSALLEGNLPVTVVLTLRADFYGHLLRYRPLVDWLKIGQVNVPTMGPEELRAAVEEPATSLGLRFEPGLVETIVEEAGEADHPLPLLESALTQLWEKREDGVLTHAAYQAVGQVVGAIGQWAEDAYTQLIPEERPLAQRVFTRLVRYGEGEVADTRQRQSLSELMTRPEEREPLHRLVQRLADARLLVTGGDLGAETVEIIHDALLQQWGRLKRWTAEQREFYLWRQRLGERLQEWEEKRQDEGILLRGALLAEAEHWLAGRGDNLNRAERGFIDESLVLRERERAARERRRRQLTLAAMGVAVVFLFLALVTWGQRNAAWDAQAVAEAEANDRATAQAQAEEHRREAEAAQATAFAEANIRATAQVLAEEQRQIALARQLAAQSQMILENRDGGLVQSVLLTVESLRRHPTLEGDHVMRQGLGLLPRTVTQTEHKDGVSVVVFSPNGQWVASGSDNGTVWVWEAATGRTVAQMKHRGKVSAIAFSPDGRWVASGSEDSTVRVWEAATGRMVAHLKHGDKVSAVAFSPDGEWVASGSYDGTARVWEVATGQEMARMTHEGRVYAVAFSSDGHRVASGSGDGTARVWEAATGQEVARMEHGDGGFPMGAVNVITFSPNGQWVASGGGDGTARVWEAATGREVSRIQHKWSVNAVAFSPNGRWVASSSRYDLVQVWRAATGQERSRMKHGDGVRAVVFSPDGWYVVTAGEYDRTARVWEVTTGREVARMEHGGAVRAVAFSPDGKWVVSGSEDGTARVWETATIEKAKVHYGNWMIAMAFSPDGRWVALADESMAGTPCVWEATTGGRVICMSHENWVAAVTFNPQGRWLATGSWDNTARVWEVTTGREVARMEHGGTVRAVAFSPDGKWVVSGSEDSTARVWEAATGREIARVTHEKGVMAVAFSPDGKWVVSGSGDGTVRVWEAATGQEVAQMSHVREVGIVAFSPEGRWIASAEGCPSHSPCINTNVPTATVRVWEAASGQEVSRMMHDNGVTAMAFSPGGHWVVSGSRDGTARVWEAATGQEVARISRQGVEAVDFSPDGRWVVSGGWDNKAQVWEAATGHEVMHLTHEEGVTTVAFSPDGHWVASGSADGMARVWLWRPEHLIAEACARLPRNLTLEEWRQYIGDEPYRPTCPDLPVPEE